MDADELNQFDVIDNDLSRFTTDDEKLLIASLETELTSSTYCELVSFINRLILSLADNESKLNLITEDVAVILIKSKQLYDKVKE